MSVINQFYRILIVVIYCKPQKYSHNNKKEPNIIKSMQMLRALDIFALVNPIKVALFKC